MVGRGFASVITARGKNAKVVVGWDVRDSSVSLANSLTRGLMDSGIHVLEAGLATTPMTRFAGLAYGTAGTVMVTASHNQMWDNGFKLTLNNKPFYGQDLQDVCDVIEKQAFVNGTGSLTCIQVQQLYKESLLKKIIISDQLKVVWIARNSIISSLLEEILGTLPGQHVIKNCTNGLVHSDYDAIFDFDTDGDRLILTDSKKQVWHGDEVLALFALCAQDEIENLQIVFDLKASRVLIKSLEALGIKCHISRVGNCFIDNKMRENGAQMGGETSGHFLFADHNCMIDDGIYTALRLLHCLSRTSSTLNQIRSLLPNLHISKSITVKCGDQDKYAIFSILRNQIKIQDLITDESSEGAILVKNVEGWYVIRLSETENALSVRCEGFNEGALSILQDRLEDVLSVVGLSMW